MFYEVNRTPVKIESINVSYLRSCLKTLSEKIKGKNKSFLFMCGFNSQHD